MIRKLGKVVIAEWFSWQILLVFTDEILVDIRPSDQRPDTRVGEVGGASTARVKPPVRSRPSVQPQLSIVSPSDSIVYTVEIVVVSELWSMWSVIVLPVFRLDICSL